MRRFVRIASFALVVAVFLAGVVPGISYGNPDLDQTRAEISELEQIVKVLEDSIAERRKKIEELDEEVRETEVKLVQAEKELSESETRLVEMNNLFADRVRSAYMKGGTSYLEVLLTAESFADLIVRTAYVRRVLTQDAQWVAALKTEQAFIKERKKEIEEHHEMVEAIRYEQEAQRRNLEEERRAKEAELASTKNRLKSELAQVTPQTNRKPAYGVILDNVVQARPQAGLSRASLVYEYEVEGRITRYLALFAEFPSKVGPIRSARTASTQLAFENDVNFVYASAGSDVRRYIDSLNMKHTNALFSSSSSFYRDASRRAPHNFYVNLATLKTASPSSQMVVRPAYLSKKGNPAAQFSLEYGSSTRISYRYDNNIDAYRRYLNGNVHRDAEGRHIIARNVVIQYVPHGVDGRRRPTPELIGSGSIDFYAQGEHFSGTWQKSSAQSPTRFYYQDGQEIEMVYGQTWIQIARPR